MCQLLCTCLNASCYSTFLQPPQLGLQVSHAMFGYALETQSKRSALHLAACNAVLPAYDSDMFGLVSEIFKHHQGEGG